MTAIPYGMHSRRQFLLSTAAVPLAAQTGKPPNIVFILTDDQRWDMMSCGTRSPAGIDRLYEVILPSAV